MLGLKTGIFGKMANDRNSKFLRASMDDLGIKYQLTLDGSASSFAEIFLDHQGDRAIYMLRGATAELTPSRNSPEARRIHPARTYRHDGNIGVAARDGRRDSALRAATHEIQRLTAANCPYPNEVNYRAGAPMRLWTRSGKRRAELQPAIGTYAMSSYWALLLHAAPKASATSE